jgi:cysteine-rich repeat protein
LYVGRLRKTQDATWELTDGLLGGRMRKDELISAYRHTGFCETGAVNTFYNIVVDFIQGTADILSSGEVDLAQDCDALSYGIAFEAGQLLPGRAVTVAPRLECCAPGKTADACAARCGDSEVSGDETCDTAIADGKPGACPAACALTAQCIPQVMAGVGCSAKCMPMGGPIVGVKDDCCPPDGNLGTDPDCKPRCGNGVIETGETCDPRSTCTRCVSPNPCFSVKTIGSAEMCDLRCELAPIRECIAGDRCCPDGCTTATDGDCSATCGDGKLDPGETCERGSSTACPSDCDDKYSCTVDLRAGNESTCGVVCAHTMIKLAYTGDACCPSGVSANSDGECGSSCGNQFVEIGEECDDGNTADGDGCSNCKKESQTNSCLTALGATESDKCAVCMCTKCLGQAVSCYTNSEPAEAMLCKNLVDCQRGSGCTNPDCFCGERSVLECLAGQGNGKCKQQTIAAAKSSDIFTINARSSDITYPLGRGNVLFTCAERSCSTECNVRR